MLVCPGVYSEHVVVGVAGLTLRSTVKGGAVIAQPAGATGPDDLVGNSVQYRHNVLGNAGAATPQIAYGIDIDGAGSGVTVSDNWVYRTFRAVIIDDSPDARVDRNVLLRSEYTGLLFTGEAVNARVRDNLISVAGTGIQVDDPPEGNVFRGNRIRVSANISCADISDGDGTLGTQNTWVGNTATVGTDNPDGLCPAP